MWVREAWEWALAHDLAARTPQAALVAAGAVTVPLCGVKSITNRRATDGTAGFYYLLVYAVVFIVSVLPFIEYVDAVVDGVLALRAFI